MNDTPETFTHKRALNEGPVIYHPEDYLIENHKTKKNLTLIELNHVFQMYLQKNNIRDEDITILGQFSLIFNNPLFIKWHTMSKQAQIDVLSETVKMPQLYDELITSISETAGDITIIKSVVKDAYQNAIDSFSHAAFLQRKYKNSFPGIKILLYVDQVRQLIVLTVVDNGYGEIFSKPKKSFSDQEYKDNFVSSIVDWIIRRYIDKDEREEKVRHDIAYTGGQGMALNKIKIELQLDVDVHFLNSGAVFETKLRNYF